MGNKNQSEINTNSRYKANWKQSRCKLKKAGANWKKQVQTEKSRCKQAGVSRCKWVQTTRICTFEKSNSSVKFQPLSLSSRTQNILFDSGREQFVCMIPFFLWPHSFSKISPMAKSFFLVAASGKKFQRHANFKNQHYLRSTIARA